MVLFIFGAIVGSFLNACIHRLPRGESIIYPASRCPRCDHALKALDLVPILSYVFLKGKCRYCGTPISPRYPLAEFLGGVLFVGVGKSFPVTVLPLDFIFNLLFVSLMLLIFFTDLEQQVIPDAASVSGIFLGLFYNYLKSIFHQGMVPMTPFLSAVYGMLLGYLLLFLIARAGERFFKKEVMGEGDLYLAALLGAYLGWEGALLSIFLAYLLAGAAVLVYMLFRKIKMGDYVPFGPALAAGGVITLFFGPQILAWYLGVFK